MSATPAPPTSAPSIPGYAIERLLGRGGCGEVWLARRDDGSVVALKTAHEHHDRLAAEACMLAALGPPHAPALHGAGQVGSMHYLVLEYVAWPTLASRLATAPFTVDDVRRVAAPMIAALAALHQLGIAHGDIKPGNIFTDDVLGARLIDFGLARDATPNAPTTATAAHAAAGTPLYMAPELGEPGAMPDLRSDVYALGCVLYEMLTGAPPFTSSEAELREMHRSHRPRPLAAVPEMLAEVVMRCLEKRPERRFASAIDVAAAMTTAPMTAPRTRSPSDAAIAPTSGRERCHVAMLFFARTLATHVVRQLEQAGGRVAHTSELGLVVVFGHDAGENPARRAARVAAQLISDEACAAIRLEVATVTVSRRAHGLPRYFSPGFADATLYPVALAGLTASVIALELLPPAFTDGATVIDGRPELRRIDCAAATSSVTTITAVEAASELVGRDAELTTLLGSAQRSVGGVATIVTVTGAPGFGKSHLAHALVGGLADRCATAAVLFLRAFEPLDGDAERNIHELLHLVLDLPRDLAVSERKSWLERALGPIHAVGALLALGWATPEDESHRRCAAAPGALRAMTARAIAEAIARRTARQPVMLVLDDAQFADHALLEGLEIASLAETRRPLWICLVGRPVFRSATPELGSRAGATSHLELARLDRSAASVLCRALLDPLTSVPQAAIDRLVERTEGVPLLLVELIRVLKREGLIRRRGHGASSYLATDLLERAPDVQLVDWIARRELERLPGELAAHARLCALLGARFELADLEGTMAQLDRRHPTVDCGLDAGVGVARLVAAGILDQAASGAIGFRHALVRAAVCDATPAALRHAIHDAAYAYLIMSGVADAGRQRLLAHHASRSGHRDAARTAYEALAVRARARHNYLESEWLYGEALAMIEADDSHRLADAYRGRGMMRYRLGRHEDALADFTLARAQLRKHGDTSAEADVLLDEAEALDWTDQYRGSRDRLDEARQLAAQVGSSAALAARLELALGRSLTRFCEHRQAVEQLRLAAEHADALGDVAYETGIIARLMLGFVLQGLGELDEAAAHCERVRHDAELHADPTHLGAMYNTRAMIWACRGDRAAMLADWERYLQIGRELGNATMEVFANYNIGEFLYLMGDTDGARPYVQRVVALERSRLGEAARPVILLLACRLHLYAGDREAVRVLLDEIDGRIARTTTSSDSALLPSEEVQRRMVVLALADAASPAWEDLEQQSLTASVGQERIELIEMRALAAARAARLGDARIHYDRALALTREIPSAMTERLERARAVLTAHTARTMGGLHT